MAKLHPNDQLFCTAYYNFLGKLLENGCDKVQASGTENKVYHLGESHCLSYAHQKIKIKGIDYKIAPKITFGGKAFHFSRIKDDAFNAITKANFDGIPNNSKVFVSFGEIDCRPNEGFITAAQKLNKRKGELITNVVKGYFNWFARQNEAKKNVLYFFNVPAPVYDDKLDSELNLEVARTVIKFNAAMNENVGEYNFGLIDVHKLTVADNGFSNGNFHIDQRHLGPNAISEFERQLN